MISRKTLLLLIFSFCLLYADDAEEFLFLHTASFNFRESIPYIRVLANEYKAPLDLEGDLNITCGSKTIKAASAKVTDANFKEKEMVYRVSLEEMPPEKLKDYKSIRDDWAKETGEELEIFTVGGVFSINDKKIDNREYYIVLKKLFTKEEAEKARTALSEKYPDRSITIQAVLMKASSSVITVETKSGKSKCGSFIKVKYSDLLKANGTSYKDTGDIFISSKSSGTLNLFIEDSVEKLIYRILPGELFISAPLEALKAQAVAARTDIFMQLGRRHIGEPFHICSEVHCQKIKWDEKAQAKKFVQAVDATKGEVILYKGLYVARAPYSSSAGGHTENIKFVWFSAEKPYLQGVWDGEEQLNLDMTKDDDAKKFIESDYGEDKIDINKRFRWEKKIANEKIDGLLGGLGIGHLKEIKPLKRGVSGRIYKILFIGDKSEQVIYGELKIRRLLDNMNSSLFVVEKSGDEWVFKGAGWGHGVGMSQMGAISLGRKGKDYKYILKRYYPDTKAEKIY